jgi:predicted CXXCH cytochrome family protein
MKKALSLLAAVALIAAASSAMASTISSTKHNLSASGTTAYKGTGSQICVYCHTPHNAYTTAPLWNRNAGRVTAGSFLLYSGVNMSNVSYKTGFTSDSISLFCMSCHDGSVLGDTMIKNVPLGEPAGLGNTNAIPSNVKANLVASTSSTTGDLRTTHPVNFPVAASTQGDLQGVTGGTTMGTTGQFPLFKATRSGVATTNSLECSSCHSVHDNTNAPFLRTTNAGSALCLGCHNK